MKQLIKPISTAIAIAGLCVGASISANASLTLWSSVAPVDGRWASVTFDDSVSGQLTVTLNNLYNGGATMGGYAISALFFSGLGTMTPESATLQGKFWYQGSEYTGFNTDDVGGEWRYQYGSFSPSAPPNGADSGISAVGLNVFGNDPNFNGPNLADPAAIDGGNFMLLPVGYPGAPPTPGNASITGEYMVSGSIIFRFSGYTGSLANLEDVAFQYGTALNGFPDDPFVPAVPEPATVLAGALLLLPFGASAIRILRKKS